MSSNGLPLAESIAADLLAENRGLSIENKDLESEVARLRAEVLRLIRAVEVLEAGERTRKGERKPLFEHNPPL